MDEDTRLVPVRLHLRNVREISRNEQLFTHVSDALKIWRYENYFVTLQRFFEWGKCVCSCYSEPDKLMHTRWRSVFHAISVGIITVSLCKGFVRASGKRCGNRLTLFYCFL